MNILNALAKDLEDFFSDDDSLNFELEDQEKEVNKELDSLDPSDLEAQSSCARLSYGSRCGFASSGRTVSVVNARNNHSVRVTVQVNVRAGVDRGSFQRVYTLRAGIQRRIGCTRGNGVRGGDYSYSIVGCELL